MAEIKARQSDKKTSNQPNNNWDLSIQEAERLINKARYRIAGLKLAIEQFKKKRDAGEPWPE